MTVHVNTIRSIRPIVRRRAEEVARAVLLEERNGDCEVSITFDGDDCLRDLNREYLGRDEPTDVIAFDLSHDEEVLIGDVYISVDRAAEQASEHGVALGEELLRLELHGILHLVGYDHAGDDRTMWNRQEEWLDRLYRKDDE